MTDYMKEAERLLAEHEQAAGLCRYEDCQRTRAALLAHIQRGAVPEGDAVRPQPYGRHCQNGGDVCLASRVDGIVCSDDSCDINTGIRATPAPAEVPMPEPVDDIDRALVPLSDHHRLTIGPGPWAGVRIGQKAFNVARAVFGTSSEDDDKRVYRTLQAYERNRTQISGESTQADFERWLERDSTLPATRDGGTYSDFSVALMWHAWQECAACCAAREAAGYARAANWLRTQAEKHAMENGYHEPDTGSFVFASSAAEEWNNGVLELADEMEAALRGEVKS